MHRIWEIEDIVRVVLSSCRLREVAALGRTCQSLFEIAMDVLWEGNEVLLPGDLLRTVWCGSEKREPFMERRFPKVKRRLKRLSQHICPRLVPGLFPIHRSNITRLAIYARRVVTIQLNTEDGEWRPCDRGCAYFPDWTEWLLLLQLSVPTSGSACLLSGVRTLDLSLSSPHALSTIVSYPWSDLSTIKLSIQNEPSRDSTPLEGYLEPVMKLARLDELNLDSSQKFSSSDRQFFESIAAHFKCLSKLSVLSCSFQTAILAIQFGFPRLLYLAVWVDSDSNLIQNIELPCLRTLHLQYERNTQALISFIRGLSAPHVEIASFRLRHGRNPEPHPVMAEDMENLMVNITTSWPELKRLYIQEKRGPDGPGDLSTFCDAWTFDVFASLLSCSLIECLMVETEMPIDLNDNDIELMAMAWPGLKKLSFDGHPVSSTPNITHRGLAALSSRCTLLSDIGLLVRLPIEDDRTTRSTSPAIQSAVTHLDVFSSPPCSPVMAATVLRGLFPNLQSFSFDSRIYGRTGWAWSSIESFPEEQLADHLKRTGCMQQLKMYLDMSPSTVRRS